MCTCILILLEGWPFSYWDTRCLVLWFRLSSRVELVILTQRSPPLLVSYYLICSRMQFMLYPRSHQDLGLSEIETPKFIIICMSMKIVKGHSLAQSTHDP